MGDDAYGVSAEVEGVMSAIAASVSYAFATTTAFDANRRRWLEEVGVPDTPAVNRRVLRLPLRTAIKLGYRRQRRTTADAECCFLLIFRSAIDKYFTIYFNCIYKIFNQLGSIFFFNFKDEFKIIYYSACPCEGSRG